MIRLGYGFTIRSWVPIASFHLDAVGVRPMGIGTTMTSGRIASRGGISFRLHQVGGMEEPSTQRPPSRPRLAKAQGQDKVLFRRSFKLAAPHPYRVRVAVRPTTYLVHKFKGPLAKVFRLHRHAQSLLYRSATRETRNGHNLRRSTST